MESIYINLTNLIHTCNDTFILISKFFVYLNIINFVIFIFQIFFYYNEKYPISYELSMIGIFLSIFGIGFGTMAVDIFIDYKKRNINDLFSLIILLFSVEYHIITTTLIIGFSNVVIFCLLLNTSTIFAVSVIDFYENKFF